METNPFLISEITRQWCLLSVQKSWPILYRKLLYKVGQDFLDIQNEEFYDVLVYYSWRNFKKLGKWKWGQTVHRSTPFDAKKRGREGEIKRVKGRERGEILKIHISTTILGIFLENQICPLFWSSFIGCQRDFCCILDLICAS